MKPIPPEQIHTGAKRVTIKGYKPNVADLPAAQDDSGLTLVEYELSAEDLARLLRGGTIRLWVHTFGRKFPPIAIETIENAESA